MGRNTGSSATPVSPTSPLVSEASGSTIALNESDDDVSLSSASGLKKEFTIPDSWPPIIMHCINQSTDEARQHELVSTVRNEIVRVLANTMFCYHPNPGKDFCTRVAKLLVKKYKFMTDRGEGVTGYVSYIVPHCCCALCRIMMLHVNVC